MRWYIVHAYSNFERKVAESIKERAVAAGLGDLFAEVLVPMEEVVEMRRGRKVSSERKFFPGYVLVKMELNDQTYHLIKATPKVTGFLGTQNKPIPITEAEAGRILQQVQEGVERPKPSVTFEIGATAYGTVTGQSLVTPVDMAGGGLTLIASGSEVAYVFPVNLTVSPSLAAGAKVVVLPAESSTYTIPVVSGISQYQQPTGYSMSMKAAVARSSRKGCMKPLRLTESTCPST